MSPRVFSGYGRRERFTLSDDDTRLDYVATVTDRVNFKEPMVDEFFWLRAPGEEVKPYECTLWDSPGADHAIEPRVFQKF